MTLHSFACRSGFIFGALILTAACAGRILPSDSDPAPPGKMVDIGGYRLHIQASGKGSQSVVLLSGMGDFSFVWSLVQPEVARFARVCSYDRAGEAWSDLGPVPRTIAQEAYELHLLLQASHLPAPYVMVGASYGGLIAREYARRYPGEVGGVVLVDSTHEDTILSMTQIKDGKPSEKLMRVREMSRGLKVPDPQTMKTSPPKPATDQQRKEDESFRKMMGPPRIDPPFDRLPMSVQKLQLWAASHPKLSGPSEGYMGEEFLAMYEARKQNPHSFGDIPLISLRAGGGGPTPSKEGLATINMSLEEWRKQAEQRSADHANLSTNSRWYIAPQSGHHIHLEDPMLVVSSIRRVVEAVRWRKRL